MNIPHLADAVNRIPLSYVEYVGLSSNEYYKEDGGDWLGERAYLYAAVDYINKDYSSFSFHITIPNGDDYVNHSFIVKARPMSSDNKLIMLSLENG